MLNMQIKKVLQFQIIFLHTITLLRLHVKKRSSHLGSGVVVEGVVGFSVEGVDFFMRPKQTRNSKINQKINFVPLFRKESVKGAQ